MPFKDPEKQKRYQAKWRRDRSRKWRNLVWANKDKPCADCGVKYPPWVMDYDHVRGTKVHGVSIVALHRGKKQVLEEIAKCDVVCSNCHRDRTYKRNQHGRVAE